MEMIMTYELITPEIAASLLESSCDNRHLYKPAIQRYADIMLTGEWDETTGATIVIDEDGMLIDGRHRAAAIVKSKVSIHAWVCRNVPRDEYFKMYQERISKCTRRIKTWK